MVYEMLKPIWAAELQFNVKDKRIRDDEYPVNEWKGLGWNIIAQRNHRGRLAGIPTALG